MKLTLKDLQYYLGQVLYEGLDPTRIDDIFADSPEAQQFEAMLPGITDILKKDAAGGSYSVYTPPPVVTPPAVTGRYWGWGWGWFDQYGGYGQLRMYRRILVVLGLGLGLGLVLLKQ
jgi:hypothetical protein